jgi:hypothetical protein
VLIDYNRMKAAHLIVGYSLIQMGSRRYMPPRAMMSLYF